MLQGLWVWAKASLQSRSLRVLSFSLWGNESKFKPESSSFFWAYELGSYGLYESKGLSRR